MGKHKIIAIIEIALIASIALLTPSTSAAPHSIILPFHTSWEDGQPLGKINSVDYKKDFYGYYGPDNPLPPELGYRNSGDMGVSTPADGTFFGYNFGSRYLMAAGCFGTSYSNCYFNLFDQTADSDYAPPLKIKPHTFINIWYYHMCLANCMIDAQLYNQRTQQYSTLRDFNYNGKYIVDQNVVRIHPAYRYSDPIGSWQFASFDLSIIYNSDPGNWYITKIWIGFDNGIDQKIGQARTYFDMLHISYGEGGGGQISTQTFGDNAWASGSIVAWDYHLGTDGKYSLWLKVTISGNSYTFTPPGSPTLKAYPQILKVSVSNAGAQALREPKPTGLNLTQPDPSGKKVSEFLTDCLFTIISWLPQGYIIDVIELADEYYGVLKDPESQPTYQWPDAITYKSGLRTYGVEQAQGEVYILISGLAPGTTSIPITFSVDYYAYPSYYVGWIKRDTGSFTLSFSWSPIPYDDTMSVGGILIPINKFELLMPWIELVSITVAAPVVAVFLVKRRKRD